ncbi:hypothetical protein AB1Y20_017335 [Prymnesium parvum]|uniref:HTH CENPB-type domain-containing protein n=1 Tax=Prymnesium parvum TaxID=97485 RepID=A0AB34JMR7_PRYPA
MHCFPRPPLAPLPVAVGSQFGTPQGATLCRQQGSAPQVPMFAYGSPQLPTSGGAGLFVRAQPWQMVTPVQMQDVNGAIREEGEMRSLSPCEPGCSAVTDSVLELLACAAKKPCPSSRTTAKRGQKERQYTIDDLKSMAAAVLSGKATSARAAALSAGLPRAERTLNRYLKDLRNKSGEEQLSQTSEKVELELQLVDELSFKACGNKELCARRLFTEDELDYFARALKLYSEMGWPMDYQQIRCMFSRAASAMGRQEWKPGEPYVCSTTYVARFVENRPELRAFKTSHVDPLRAKKATVEVCR